VDNNYFHRILWCCRRRFQIRENPSQNTLTGLWCNNLHVEAPLDLEPVLERLQ
jgi:hypothetical protein